MPTDAKVMKTFDMIIHSGLANMPDSRGGRSIDEQSQEIMRKFSAMAPSEANAIIGVQVATDVVLYDIGRSVVYFTFSSNPAVLEEE